MADFLKRPGMLEPIYRSVTLWPGKTQGASIIDHTQPEAVELSNLCKYSGNDSEEHLVHVGQDGDGWLVIEPDQSAVIYAGKQVV